VTLLLNHKLVSRAKLYLVSVFPDIVKVCPKIRTLRNLPKILLRSFQNVAPGSLHNTYWHTRWSTNGCDL